MNSVIPTFRGLKVFVQFPNTSPSGKRVDSDYSLARKIPNSGKKRHPRNVGVDTCLATVILRQFLETTPLPL
jgi:hypothetical protein